MGNIWDIIKIILLLVISIIVFIISGFWFIWLFIVPYDSGNSGIYYLFHGAIDFSSLIYFCITFIPFIISGIIMIISFVCLIKSIIIVIKNKKK